LNFSGDVILYDSEQYKLFTLTLTSKDLQTLATVSGKIDAMDFGKSKKCQKVNLRVRFQEEYYDLM
jgi:hypothetical protein